jgi:4-hydroxy-tetrahydrodipicolinate synthase
MIGLQGVHAAAITPRGSRGDLDLGAAFELLDFLAKARVQGIVLFMAAGEYASLADCDRSRLTYLAVKRSRVPVWAGVGSANLDASIALAREARDAGAAGIILPPPYFFRYQQDDLREYYLQFAAQIGPGASILIANTPAFASRLEVSTALELLATGRFAGLADASGSVESFRQLHAATPGAIAVAHDAVFARSRCAGARGCISEVACAVPELMVALERAIVAEHAGETERLDAGLQEFLAWMDQFPHPIILKTAAALRGLKTGPPLIPLTAAKQKKLDEFRTWFQAWLPMMNKLAARA